ncbi:MAG: N-sulfoglucosamine sulfohydrolase [Saprospiraceae bacterium]|jgi:N-sulfoglucosamine sulfohydrolase
MATINDKRDIPEVELINQFWPGKVQALTSASKINTENGKNAISCATEGAYIGYIPSDTLIIKNKH